MCPLKETAREAPDSPSFGQTTFREFDALADAQARVLENSGIRPGDRIALRHPPCIEAAALFFAAWRLGASISPLSLRLPLPQIEAHLERLDAKAYIDSFPLTPQIRKSSNSLPYPAALLFTSGSTGQPKIAVLSLSNLLANAASAVTTLKANPGDSWLLNLPLFHVGGIGILLRCVLAKMRLVLDPSDPNVTHVSAVPTQLYRATPVYKNLKCLLIGGAPIPSYPERLPCWLSYGLTEMGSLVAAGRPEPCYVLPGREIRIAASGEIMVRGSCLFQGYWEEGRVIPSFDAQGWFATGDLGTLTGGALTVSGRKDWQFISGGENIQPEEIESALLSLPGVEEAAVVPIPDPEFGERPAAVLKASSQDGERLKRALLDRLPKFKIPVKWIFVDEMPKNGLKINRKLITKMFN